MNRTIDGDQRVRTLRSQACGTRVKRSRVLKIQVPKRSWTAIRTSASAIVVLAMLAPMLFSVNAAPPAPLPPGTIDPLTIPKFVTDLTGAPPVYKPVNVTNPDNGKVMWQEYTIEMEDDLDGSPILQQILPAGFPKTPIWGYAGTVYSSDNAEGKYSVSAPGATIEATRDLPVHVKWINNIDNQHMFAVDPTLHWANPNDMMMPMPPVVAPPYPPGYEEAQSPVPAVPHLHGGEVSSWYDGGPDAWFTYNGVFGPGYDADDPPEDLIAGTNAVLYKYPNEQPATTLWYHDHALGITRINVMSGLAGFYLLRDPADPIASLLPSGKYEVPLVIQDRTFNLNGSFWFDTLGINPDIHPYWTPEFFGNAIMVNGVTWPNMNVDQGQYRFRLLDGSNARFYTLTLVNAKNEKPIPFTVIGSDGGYLRAPATTTQLTIAPGERYDVLVDFSGIKPGTKIVMKNSAKTPFPNGVSPHGATTGQIMQFTVMATTGLPPAKLPAILNPDLAAFPSLSPPTAANIRFLVLTEVMGLLGPTEVLLNGLKWDFPVTEQPEVGTTEDWVIVNPTADTHPIHLHLIQFQVLSRQRVDTALYDADWLALNGNMMPPFEFEPEPLDPAMYLKGAPIPANPWEQGWKDTVQMNPGEVTIIRARWAPISSADVTPYPFDPTEGPGYVWHCHILDHEDNEMMRPYVVMAATSVSEPL